MELYEVTVEYVKYLRKFEPTKIMSNADGKEQRKFLGVIVQKNGYKYVIPLSSPKYKKDYKIRDYQGENLPEDFSFVAYADRIIFRRRRKQFGHCTHGSSGWRRDRTDLFAYLL